jgi:hypothetical protein
MKVKIGDKIYDGAVEPIMIILSKEDKKQITEMHPDATKYCQYPDKKMWRSENYANIKDWMKTPTESNDGK